MAVSNEISGVQEQNNECASVQFYLSVHFKCAKKLLNLYFVRNSNKKGNNCCENISGSGSYILNSTQHTFHN